MGRGGWARGARGAGGGRGRCPRGGRGGAAGGGRGVDVRGGMGWGRRWAGGCWRGWWRGRREGGRGVLVWRLWTVKGFEGSFGQRARGFGRRRRGGGGRGFRRSDGNESSALSCSAGGDGGNSMEALAMVASDVTSEVDTQKMATREIFQIVPFRYLRVSLNLFYFFLHYKYPRRDLVAQRCSMNTNPDNQPREARKSIVRRDSEHHHPPLPACHPHRCTTCS